MKDTLKILAVTLVTLLSFVITDLAAQQQRDILEQAIIEPQLGGRLPMNAELTDAAGKPISIAEIVGRGRPTV